MSLLGFSILQILELTLCNDSWKSYGPNSGSVKWVIWYSWGYHWPQFPVSPLCCSPLKPEKCRYEIEPFVFCMGLLQWLSTKESACSAGGTGDVSSIPGLGRTLGVGNGNLLQYSCLESSMGRGAWWATVHGAAKSWTQLSDWSTMLCMLYTGKKNPQPCILFMMLLCPFLTWPLQQLVKWARKCSLNSYSVQFSFSVVSDSLRPHGPQHA